MKLGKRGFIASAVLYVMLGLFIALMIGVIAIYSNRKIMMDKVEENVIKRLEQDNKVENKVGERNDYYEAARAYMKDNSEFDNFNKDSDVSLIDVNSLINAGLLSKDIVSPITNRKEVTQNNYVVAVVDGEDYNFSYVDNATAKDYISVINKLESRVSALEDASGTGASLLNKTYPVGSIYITTNYTTATSVANVLGGTWEAYGSGRTLVGVNTGDSNFNTVGKTGGASTTTLTTANLPAHTHSIPALSGTAANAGAHTHSIPALSGTAASAGAHTHAIQRTRGTHDFTVSINEGSGVSWVGDNIGGNGNAHWFADSYRAASAGAHTHNVTTKASTSGSSGAHTHSISTTANTSGSTGSTTAFTNLQPYITVYMYKRIG